LGVVFEHDRVVQAILRGERTGARIATSLPEHPVAERPDEADLPSATGAVTTSISLSTIVISRP
jgi:hypothetical protein